MENEQTPRALIVIGASAGGIEALSTLLGRLPEDFPAPIVIAQHLAPTRPSHLGEILGRRTPLAVHIVMERERLEPGAIYVVPANRHVEITDSDVSVRERDGDGPRPSIDRLLTTASRSFGEQLIAVILTGNGSDGAAGAREVHGAGGTVIIQNPETAPFPGLPLSLAPTDVDIIANVEQIAAILVDLTTGVRVISRPTEERALRTFLDQLRQQSGIDFSAYKMPTIMRRLQRRMVATGADRLSDYVRYLQSHPEEYQRLVSSFLIKVTEFFRDAELFEAIRDRILPDLIGEARNLDNELRIWSAGCATGEEAYSLAILLSELLGVDLERLNVRIFATDLDNDAVAFARRGIYPPAALANVPPDLIERYFTAVEGEYEIKKAVRALMIFGQHDLGQRAPFPRIDLTLCRNVLIYFTTELQKRALQLFAFSLRKNGYLVLGKSETTTPLAEHFALEDAHLKVYRRQGDRILIPPARIRDTTPLPPLRLLANARAGVPAESARAAREPPRQRTPQEKNRNILLNLPVGVVVVDRRYDIETINGTARQLFGIHTTAVGEDFIHLVQTLPPAPLRDAIDAAFRGEIPAAGEELSADLLTGDVRYLELVCYPQKLAGGPDAVESVLILATDMTERKQRQRNLEQMLDRQREETERLNTLMKRLAETNRQLVAANQELANTDIELRNANEEFLVSSEEAQAASEEIETLNEELQATNEELETLNEELQATVEELNTTNDDLQARTVELQEAAVALEAQRNEREDVRTQLAAALLRDGDAVVVVDEAGAVLLSNAAYTTRFGDGRVSFTAEDEQGQPLVPDVTPQARVAIGETFVTTVIIAGADGVRRRYEVRGHPIRTDQRQGGVLILRDVGGSQ